MADELNQDVIEPTEPTTRREDLSAMFDKAEAGEPIAPERPRDEQGKFAPKPKADVAAEPKSEPQEQPKTSEPEYKISTWRKEYAPLQEKLAKGEPLTAEDAKKLAAYNVEREKQYATGISTYKGEAQEAKAYKEAMAEFLPALQQHNINPTQWIQNLGRAHQTLAMGRPEQKLQMFAKLAQDYGVPLGAITQSQNGQVDAVSLQLMQEIQKLTQGLTGITSWRQQQEEQLLAREVAKFSDASQYPHFEQVRETMIQLLESGVAQDPDEAYRKAVRLDDSIQPAAPTPQPAQNTQRVAVGKAKAAAGQVKSAAPRSTTNPAMAAKDRRSALAASFEAADNTGRF